MFCTFPRMRTLKILCAAFAVMPAAPPVPSPAQSEMHVSVIVVPAVMPPHHRKPRERDEDTVVYNLNTQRETMSVTEEIRPMLVQEDGGARLEQVRITTVVAK